MLGAKPGLRESRALPRLEPAPGPARQPAVVLESITFSPFETNDLPGLGKFSGRFGNKPHLGRLLNA